MIIVTNLLRSFIELSFLVAIALYFSSQLCINLCFFCFQGSGKTLAFAIPILNYILKLHPQLNLAVGSAKNRKKPKLEKQTKPNQTASKSTKKMGRSKVIDLNQVSHSIEEDQPETGSETGNEAGSETGSETAAQEESLPGSDNEMNDGTGSDVEAENDKLVFEIDSEADNRSLSDDEHLNEVP